MSTKEWVLDPETEYRFELDPGTSIAIKLLRGHAEIFGAELVEGKAYLFGFECKAAVFTWQGCTIEVVGHPSTEYLAEETPMAVYANLHMALEQMRVRAQISRLGSPSADADADAAAEVAESPRVLVLGPESAGKTTVCKLLVNYAVRVGQGWAPVLVDVDPSEGGCTVPGTLAAATVAGPIATASPVNVLGASATSAPTVLASNALSPLVYWYGHADTRKNPRLFERLIRNLGEDVLTKAQAHTSGVIIDTPASFAAVPNFVKACVDAFRVNVILVVGQEKLYAEMQRLYPTVVKIPKSGGVVELDSSYRQRVNRHQIHAYMYGLQIDPPPNVSPAIVAGEAVVLSPSSSIVSFDDITIYRIGQETMAPASALPIGAARTLSEMQPILLDPTSPVTGLLHRVLAVLASFHPDENERYDEEILDLPVVGFLVVTHLDIPNKKMTILSPTQSQLAGKTALVGTFEWQE